ncbi:MAG: HlyD family efflux transporter periplasmic adaptor subunit [Bacteroidetes bacterium]|nr:HlyD family efflux transporter periplasmic adaptor subunit [Bacteroidota bacterium]
MTEEKEIHLRTEEVNELLTATPRWIIRWGISLVFIIMLLALTLSFFIRYPDTLTASALITTINPPVTLVAKTSGKISALKVTNGQPVKKGDVLLVIDNTADYRTVFMIDSLLDHLAPGSGSGISPASLNEKEWNGTGELTPAFLILLESYSDYRLFLEMNPQQQEIAIINKELEEYSRLQDKYQTQESIYREELALVETDFNRYNSLLREQSIAIKEFEDKKREYLSAKRNYESVKISALNNKLMINNLEKSRLQLQMQAWQEKEKHEQELKQSIQSLKAGIESWKQTYLLKAPIDGTASLFSFWTKGQHIKEGDEVLSIVPSEKQEVIARLTMSAQNSGKLQPGQTANIKLSNYPYQEYGMLKGTIKRISKMPKDNNYSIEVSLPEGLLTSYHKQLEYRENMAGTADVITDELSVSGRVFRQFREIMNR